MKSKSYLKLIPVKIIWDNLLRDMPRIVIAYHDGGLEFLKRFVKKKGILFYENRLVLPDNRGLIFQHPVKNKSILENLVLR